MEKTQHENINQKKAGVAIIICDKVDLRATGLSEIEKDITY